MADLDRCPVCASVHLVRRLGEVECRDCGAICDSAVPADSPVAVGSRRGGFEPGDAGTPGLAEEVEQALVKVLRRPARPGSPAGIG